MANNKYLRLLNGAPTADVEFDDANIPSTDEKAGLVGTQGTPNSANVFITEQHNTLATQDQADALDGVSGFPPTGADPVATEDYVLQEVGTASAGRNWLPAADISLDYIKTTAGDPIGVSYTNGEVLINTNNNQEYTASGGSMGTGSTPATGKRFWFGIDGDLATPEANTTGVADNNIYEFNGATFDTITPSLGDAICITDINRKFVFNGAAWVPIENTVDHNETQNLQGGNGSTEFFHATSNQDDSLSSLTSTDHALSVTDRDRIPMAPIVFSHRGGFAANTTQLVFDLSGSDTVVNLGRAGSIVKAVAEISGAAPTAGQLDVVLQADESAANTSLNLTIDNATTDNHEKAKAAAGVVTFTDSIGVEIQSDASWDATTVDITIHLYPVYNI